MTLDKLQTRFVDEILHGNTHLILTGRRGSPSPQRLGYQVILLDV